MVRPARVEDCWGRSLWAFGSATRHAPEEWMRQSAMSYFDRGAQQRSPWPRSMTFAALGAAEVLAIDPRHDPARRLLSDTAGAIGALGADHDWPWPEPRLAYANAALPEALIAVGEHAGTTRCPRRRSVAAAVVASARNARRSLLAHRCRWSRSRRPLAAFDQQPIEVAAMADACTLALRSTGDDEWRHGIERAAAWFGGANDAGAVMWDQQTGGAYDGLERDGVNRNQGTESTLALIATMQRARSLAPAA